MNEKESTLDRAVRFTRNLEWLEQVEKVIPSGCSTLAKAPERLFPGHTPYVVQRLTIPDSQISTAMNGWIAKWPWVRHHGAMPDMKFN